jgi:hypothetical protein
MSTEEELARLLGHILVERVRICAAVEALCHDFSEIVRALRRAP